MAQPRIKIVPYSPDLAGAYAAFARTSFGAASYQAAPRYLHWLYECNPLSRGSTRDMWVAQADNAAVVGCIHTMRLNWIHRGQERVVPSLHNTMMHPEYRGVAGGMLILQAFKGEPHAFVPGAEGAVADALRRMKFTVVTTSWSRRALRPLAGGIAYVAHALGYSPAGIRLARDLPAGGGEFVPKGQADLAGCVALANHSDTESMRPCWTPEAFFWRFFHPEGPRHVLLITGSTTNPDGYVIISLGLRKGLRLARIVDLQARSSEVRLKLLEQATVAARRQRMDLLLDHSVGVGQGSAPRWSPYASPAQTLFYHRSAKEAPAAYSIPAAAGDYGFEAILTTP